MAFVCEPIPEVDRPLIPDAALSNRFGHRMRPSKWVIDRSKNAYLIVIGSHGAEAYDLYTLTFCLNGEVTRFLGRMAAAGDNASSHAVTWELFDFQLPTKSDISVAILFPMINQALSVYGLYGDRATVRSVDVKIR